MRKILTLTRILAVCSFGVLAVACNSDGGGADVAASGNASSAPSDGARPTIVVTTSILGDVVSAAVGDLAEVDVIMPIGADPHDFAASARQAEAMEDADLLVVNGAGFESGMTPVIEQVERSGTPVFAFADHVELLENDDDQTDEPGHDDDEEHDDEEHDDEEHAHEGADPHLWTDPTRMIAGVTALGVEFGAIDGLDAAAAETHVQAYVDELTALDREMEAILAVVPTDRRVLVTNHEVFGYFADRFDFAVVGAVIPSLTTNAEPSAAEVDELASLIEREGIPAIFGDTSGSTQLAETLAAAVGSDVEVVVLYSESLGEPGSGAETYLDLMRTNATLIAGAMTP